MQAVTPTKNFHFLINFVNFFFLIILLLSAPCFVFGYVSLYIYIFFCFFFIFFIFADYINTALIAF